MKLHIVLLLLGLATQFSAFAGVEAHFNKPKGLLQTDDNLEDILVEYIDGAVSGSRAFLSFYQLKSKRVVKSLGEANHRGVELHIVMDDIAREKSYAKTLAQLGAVVPASALTVCAQKGCLNFARNNHNKFFLFERVRVGKATVEHVTIQASHNFKKSQTYNFNDMLIFSERPDVFAGFRSYWQALHDQVETLDYMAGPNGVIRLADGDKTTLYFSPSVTIDPYVEELKNFDCGNDGEILIGQSFFAESRGRSYLARLDEIKAQYPGCRIEALVRKDATHNDLGAEIGASQVIVKAIDRVSSLGLSIHSKMMLLKDSHGNKRVLTGSMNMMDRSLAGDESVIGISNAEIYDQYRAYWQHVDRKTKGKSNR